MPNGRGSKTHFCTVGFEIGHLTSASNIVPKYFSLNWHFLSHSFRRRLGELFYFSCLFFFLHRSLSIFFMVAFSSATTSGICLFCSVSLLLFLLVVFVFFWLVSLLLFLLRHSFLSLDFYLLVFFVLFSFVFLRVRCFFPMSSDILSAGPPDAALICCRRTMDDIAPLLARNPTKTKKKTEFVAILGRHCFCQDGITKTRIFVHTLCFGHYFFWGPEPCKPGTTINTVV